MKTHTSKCNVSIGLKRGEICNCHGNPDPTLAQLGQIVLSACGKESVERGYRINADDLPEIGRQALAFGDINRDGTLN